jgi:hypothetical protein
VLGRFEVILFSILDSDQIARAFSDFIKSKISIIIAFIFVAKA